MDWANLRAANHHEWLLTNGLGGYALGFGDLLAERKYNGLLIASLERFERVHILATVEEEVEWQGARFNLDTNHYSNCIHPQGYAHIIKNWLRPHPTILYSSDPVSDRYLVLKEIFIAQGTNAVVVKYTNLGVAPVNLTIRPKFTLRDHHGVNHPGVWDREELVKTVQERSFRLARVGLDLAVWGHLEEGEVWDETVVYRNVYYPYEAARGYEATEDLIAPVRARFKLLPGSSNRLVVGLNLPEAVFKLADQAEAFYCRHPLPQDHPRLLEDRPDWLGLILHNQPVYSQEAYLQTLDLAARDFLANDDLIAGYPWFGPWSRDTLISLGALKHLKGGPRQAVRILKKYGREIKGGLLPNVFGEGGRGTNYDSVDAPLWYVLRGHEFAPRDKELFGRCREIVLSFLFDPDPRVHVGDDGLIDIRPGEYALTWMDAKVYGQPVTPRWGKPVEINALWYNALMALLEMARAQGLEETDNLGLRAAKINLMGLAELAREVKRSLQGFVVGDYLADRLTDQGPVTEIRPNAVVAASLPFDWLEKKTLADVLKKAEEELLTPKGLRTLSSHAPGFKKKYLGNQKQRDLAYHQGTVWAWLLWPMAELYLKVHQGKKNPEALARALTNFVWRFRSAFRRNHIASVAEIWDGLEPELPKGCPAQAWSTLALLQIEHVIKDLEAKA